MRWHGSSDEVSGFVRVRTECRKSPPPTPFPKHSQSWWPKTDSSFTRSSHGEVAWRV